MKFFIDYKLKICDKSFQETPQGYLLLEGIISRSGSQEYLDFEIGAGVAGRKIIVDRPREEVVDSMSIASFFNVPIVDEHPEEGQVNPSNFSRLSKGLVLEVEPTDSGQLKAKMIVQDESLIKKIKDGKRELSAGYTAEMEFSDDGKSAVQRKIRGNHVAFVDAARCGKECSIFDSKPKTGDKPIMAKVTINKVEYEMADSAAPAVVSLISDNDSLKKNLEDSEAELQKQKAIADAADEKVKKLMEDEEDEDEIEKKISDAAHSLLGVITDAAFILKDYDATGKSEIEIKKAAVVDSKPEYAEKPEAYIEAMFDLMVSDAKSSDKMADAFRDQNGSFNDGEFVDAATARKKAIERKQNAWKGGKK